jgi:hypothetical protein
MKILINLVGLSHHDVGNFFHTYDNCHENLFKNLVVPLRRNGHQVDFYLKTYDTERENEIIQIYNPVRSEFIGMQSAFDTYIQSVDALEEMCYDFYIVTRFDLWIGAEIDLNFNKFNFLFKEKDSILGWDRHNLTTDTFYAFPKEMLEGFVGGIKNCRANHAKMNAGDGKPEQHGYVGLFHALYKDLQHFIDPSLYHYIEEEKTSVQLSNKYTLGRYA